MPDSLKITLEQKQVLTMSQKQSLDILAWNMQELCDFLQKEIEENPVIEFEPVGRVQHTASRRGLGDGLLDVVRSEEPVTAEDILLSQIDWNRCDEAPEAAFRAVAAAVDDNGFLAMSTEEIARAAMLPIEDVTRALFAMKELEPIGVCSESIQEALLRQASRAGVADRLLIDIVERHLEDVARGKTGRIARALKTDRRAVESRIEIIRGLNPRPLNGLVGEPSLHLVPDVVLKYEDGSWQVDLNDGWFEGISVSGFYLRMYNEAEEGELKEYLREKLARLRFLKEAIRRRRETLLRVSERLAVCQQAFFLRRAPLARYSMTELACELDMHPSTVSRAVRGKYIRHPSGVSEMRALFVGGVSGADQCPSFSRDEIKRKILAIVEAEDRTSPLSDEQIVRALSEDSVAVSRRAVAKYRQELCVGGMHERKRL